MNYDAVSNWKNSILPDTKLSRRAWPIITYRQTPNDEKHDITESVTKYFLSLSYTDNLTGNVDDLTISLEDRAHLWIGDWFPNTHSLLNVSINTLAWNSVSEGQITLNLGEFEIDEISGNLMPDTIQLKAVSAIASMSTDLRGKEKSKTWENISVWGVAAEIAKNNKLELFWDSTINPNVEHGEQSDESDLSYLQKICKDAGLALKITGSKIIIFEESKFEEAEAKVFIRRPGGTYTEEIEGNLYINQVVGSVSYKFKTRDIFRACHVKYKHGKKGTVIEGIYTAPDKKDNVALPTLFVKEEVSTVAEAEALAKKKLREKNADEVTVSINLPGNTNLLAGVTIMLEGWGKLDGKYLVTKAQHDMSGAYTTRLDMRRCLSGY